MAGFKFTESLRGTFQMDGRERALSFQATARAENIWQFLHNREATLEGTITAPGLAAQAPLRGTIVIDPVVGHVIRYDFEFPGDDGHSYRFVGQKDIMAAHPVESWTTLPAEIRGPNGTLRATALLHFEAEELVPFLKSFRAVL